MGYRPFEKVPPELLSRILTLAWPEDDRNSDQGSPDRFYYPSIPLQVDRYFHRTALSTTIIWSYLLIHVATHLEHIQDRIQRKSGALRLDLHIDFSHLESRRAGEMIQRTLMQSPSRFRNVTLSYPHDNCILARAPSATAFWDHLRPLTTIQTPLRVASLSISTTFSRHIPPLDLLPAFGYSLHSIHLSGCSLAWSAVTFPKSLDILSLEITFNHPNDIIQCLGSIHQSLISLSLRSVWIQQGTAVSLSPSTIYSLEQFKLGSCPSISALIILGTILAPNLHHLSLEAMLPSLPTEPLATLLETIRFPNLQKLTVSKFYCYDVHIAGLLGNLPDSVWCLEITRAGPTDMVMRNLLGLAGIDLWCGLRHIIAEDVPPYHLVELARRCPSLQTLEGRFGQATDLYEYLPPNAAIKSLETLSRVVPDLKILIGRRYIDTSGPLSVAILEDEGDSDSSSDSGTEGDSDTGSRVSEPDI